MADSTEQQQADIGMVGLGTMGLNLALNLGDQGFAVAGYDRDPSKLKALEDRRGEGHLTGASSLPDLLASLQPPRALMMMVPAGPPVDAVLEDLLPLLQPGDVVMDGGNSHFSDTEVRAQKLAEKGAHFLGVGISGGEAGARRGASIMPGGPREAYDRVRPMLEAIAAKVDGEPCVTYLGPGSAGHYVKMVHNGIEYGLMQLIAESYAIMKLGLGLTDDELHAVYAAWSQREHGGYLLEITADIFLKQDELTGQRLINVILDVARQKGTGMWASEEAMELHVPTPMINTAVEMRDLSALDRERAAASRIYQGPPTELQVEREPFIETLGQGLYAAMLIAVANGMDMLRKAAEVRGYGFELEHIARIWRGGCIIRMKALELVRQAYAAQPDLRHLMLSGEVAAELMARQEALRQVVVAAARHGLAAANFMTALYTYDAFRSDWLPDNLIQAQRDYFGAHTYERTDRRGEFHTVWQNHEAAVLV